MSTTKFPNGVGADENNKLTTSGLTIGGTLVTATAAELNAAAGTGVSSTELDLLDGAIAGTAVANKALALGATKNVDTLVIADSGLSLGAGAGTPVTSTAAELNILDGVTSTAAELNILDGVTSTAAELNILDGVTSTFAELNILDGVTSTFAELNILDTSAQTETIIAAGVVSTIKRITNLDSSAGTGAVTLAAPDASMLGQVKVIQMTVAGFALTLALTNVQGGSAGTSASFDAVDETLVLVAGTSKWTVVGEAGVTLT